MKTPSKSSGFTLVELAIVTVILSVIMGAVWSTSTKVNATVETNSRSIQAMSAARGTMRRIAKFMRVAKLSTITVQAVQADVDLGYATAVGEWISPTDLVWRPGIRFLCASGTESMNAALNTLPRELTFTIDPSETANSADDDGDGLVDEGVVRLVHDNATVAVVRDVEECMFMLDGRLLAVRLRCGKGDGRGRAIRAQVTQDFYMRNN
jgi:prepilin-type N-terminal cleavage/methylation domain-containing protein